MKHFFSTIISLFISLTVMAQIVLVPGKFTTKDGKGFVVVEHEGTQAELYDKVYSKIVSIYNDPKSVVSENKPKVITLNGIANGISFKVMGQTYYPLIHYKMNVYFKDGKIRFDAPSVIGTIKDSNRPQVIYSLEPGRAGMTVFPVFKKDGDTRNDEMKSSMENYFNALIATLTKDLDNKDGGIPEDW